MEEGGQKPKDGGSLHELERQENAFNLETPEVTPLCSELFQNSALHNYKIINVLHVYF